VHHFAVFSSSDQPCPGIRDGLALLAAANIRANGDSAGWLHQEQAWEVLVEIDGAPDMSTLRQQASEQGADINILPAAGRRKKLLIADMDSTIITSESLDDMARIAGLAEAIMPITGRALPGLPRQSCRLPSEPCAVSWISRRRWMNVWHCCAASPRTSLSGRWRKPG
jgi:hypothetical protein